MGHTRAVQRIRAMVWTVATGLCLASCTPPPSSRAARFFWDQYLDTPLLIQDLFTGNRTLAVRFLALYERAYEQTIFAQVPVVGTAVPVFRVGVGFFDIAGVPAPTGPTATTPWVGMQVGTEGAVYEIPNPVPTPDDYTRRLRGAAVVPAPLWRELILVHRGSNLEVWLNGVHLCRFGLTPCDMPIPSATPTGRIRLGKRLVHPSLEQENQFFGFIDDVGIIDYSMTQGEILAGTLAQQGIRSITPGLRMGINFNDFAADPSPRLVIPKTLSGSASIVPISPSHSVVLDWPTYPEGVGTQRLELPFARGEEWEVLGTMNGGSHEGRNAFCLDLILVPNTWPRGSPLGVGTATEGHDILAAAPGRVVRVQEGFTGSLGLPNTLEVERGPREIVQYVHLRQNSVAAALGDPITTGMRVAAASNVGTVNPHNHMTVLTAFLEPYVTRPWVFTPHCASDDFGMTWRRVDRKIPAPGVWLRHLAPEGSC